MKRILIAATCLMLLAPAISSAQPDQNRPGRPGAGQGGPRPGGPGGGQRPGGPGGGQNRPNPGNRPGGPSTGGPGRPNPGGGNRPNPGNRPTPLPGPGRPQPGRPGNRPGNPGFRPGRPGNRPGYMGWNGRRVHGPRWNWPSGYGYQRWSVGGILPAIFLSQAYWYSGYAALGFEAPPWGYQWVRYGPDLLLVQIGTGRVVDVEYGVFY
ncbi:MAG: RcnB family protein [Caulobacteraceae bacterium]